MKIAIDAGHGGKDVGAKGLGMTEAKINLNVARKLKELCEKAGHKVIMIRDSDVYIGINERAKIGRGADVFVSIHHNAGKGDGYEVIYQMNNKQSLALANLIDNEFFRLNNKRRIFCRPSVKYPTLDFFGVLRESKCPAVITEFAFLDSADVYEVDTLKEQHEEAQAIFNALQKFFK